MHDGNSSQSLDSLSGFQKFAEVNLNSGDSHWKNLFRFKEINVRKNKCPLNFVELPTFYIIHRVNQKLTFDRIDHGDFYDIQNDLINSFRNLITEVTAIPIERPIDGDHKYTEIDL